MSISSFLRCGCSPCEDCNIDEKRDADAPTVSQGDEALQMNSSFIPGLHYAGHYAGADDRYAGADDRYADQQAAFPDWRPAVEQPDKQSTEAAKEPEDSGEKERDEQRRAAAKAEEDRKRKALARKEEKEKKRQEDLAKAEERVRKEKEAEEQTRRERLGTLANPKARLQVRLDDGWSEFGQDEFKAVCDQVAGGVSRFTIQCKGAMYVIDWSDPKAPAQINARTQKRRELRVVTN